MENHVDRPTQMGKRVLINDGWYYSIDPRSYLIVGNSAELQGNDDKIACFELYRRNVRAPEILTFDELLYRAGFIVQNISQGAAIVK